MNFINVIARASINGGSDWVFSLLCPFVETVKVWGTVNCSGKSEIFNATEIVNAKDSALLAAIREEMLALGDKIHAARQLQWAIESQEDLVNLF